MLPSPGRTISSASSGMKLSVSGKNLFYNNISLGYNQIFNKN